MNVTLTKAAKADIVQAAKWYERKEKGLGDKFLYRVGRAIGKIALNPLGYAKVMGENRRCNIDKFPYALWFKVAGDAVVVACLHSHRDPKLVRERVSGVTPIHWPEPS